LFGEETGHVDLDRIKTVSPSEEIMPAARAAELFNPNSEGSSTNGSGSIDSNDSESAGALNDIASSAATATCSASNKVTMYSFVITTADGYIRTFRCSSLSERERWVEALTMAISAFHNEASLAAQMSPVRSVERQRSLTGVDFAPVKKEDLGVEGETFLYHSDIGGSCWGGSAAPITVVICCGKRIYNRVPSSRARDRLSTNVGAELRQPSVFDSSVDNDFGEHNQTFVDVSSKEDVSIYLSNAGVCNLSHEDLLRLSVEGEMSWVDVFGTRYSGAPDNLSAKLAVKVSEVKEKHDIEGLLSLAENARKEANSDKPLKEKLLYTVNFVRDSQWTNFFVVAVGVLPTILGYWESRGGTHLEADEKSASAKVGGGGLLESFFGIRGAAETEVATANVCAAAPTNHWLPFFSLLMASLLLVLAIRRRPKKYKITLLSYSEAETPLGTTVPPPQRFINGTRTDPPGTAQKRWAATMKWRKAEKVDTILLQKHPNFLAIKRCYPHFYCRRSASGKEVCYYERPGFLDLEELEDIGLPVVVRHYMYQNEFCWTYMSGGEDTRSLSGVDVQNVGLYDIKGVVKEFLGAISKISQEHYPERAGRICILNTPSWFSMLWSVIKLMLHPNTQKKVFILSKSEFAKTLQKLINKEDLVMEYGGELDFTKLRNREGAEAYPTAAEDFYGHLGKEQEAARYCR